MHATTTLAKKPWLPEQTLWEAMLMALKKHTGNQPNPTKMLIVHVVVLLLQQIMTSNPLLTFYNC